MNLQQILDWANVRISKEQRGNAFSPSQYNTALLFLNLEMFKRDYGLPEEYRPGQPLPRISFEVTQKISDDMRLVKVRMDGSDFPPLTVNRFGRATLPSNYIHRLSVRYSYVEPGAEPTMTEIDQVDENEWASRLSNSITKPTAQNPCCIFYPTYIQFEPKNLVAVEFVYLRLPNEPFYDFYYKADGRITYLPPGTTHTLTMGEIGSQGQTSGTVTSQSVELEWPADTHGDIANLLYKTMAANLRDGFAYGDAVSRQREGQ